MGRNYAGGTELRSLQFAERAALSWAQAKPVADEPLALHRVAATTDIEF
jgi:hypothetical protein